MLPWVRRLVTILAVALLTAGASLWWLYDGDLEQGLEPVVQDVHDAMSEEAERGATPARAAE